MKKEGGFWEMLLGMFCCWLLVYIEQVWRRWCFTVLQWWILSPLLGDPPNEKVNSVGSLLRHWLHGRPIDSVTLSFEHITCEHNTRHVFTDAAMKIPFTAKPGILLLSAPFRSHGPAAAFPKHSQGSEGGLFVRTCLYGRWLILKHSHSLSLSLYVI